MSCNLHLVEPGLVLRVHHPSVSRRRVLAERSLKRALLSASGVTAAGPVRLGDRETLSVDGRVAELERFVEHTVLAPTTQSYRWLFETIGTLHRRWGGQAISRPRVSTYGPPSTLRGLLARLAGRLSVPEARQQAAAVAAQVRRLDRLWVPATQLPGLLVHGDARLENLTLTGTGVPLVLDLGFTAVRPRVHDLAYAMAWILLGPDDAGPPDPLPVLDIQGYVAAYETSSGSALSEIERRAFTGYLAGTCLYLSCVAARVPEPDRLLLEVANRRLVTIAQRVLDQPRLLG